MSDKHLDLDQVLTLQEPITFKVGGKNYKINGVTDEMLAAVDAMAEKLKADESKGPCEMLATQIGIFTGKPASEFKKLDLFALRKIVQHITANINDPLEVPKPEPDATE